MLSFPSGVFSVTASVFFSAASVVVSFAAVVVASDTSVVSSDFFSVFFSSLVDFSSLEMFFSESSFASFSVLFYLAPLLSASFESFFCSSELSFVFDSESDFFMFSCLVFVCASDDFCLVAAASPF